MLPNLIVIGAAKAGTSSLYNYLGRHPEVTMSSEKELRFFVDPGRWSRGVSWYEAQFAGMPGPIRGEASPQYTTHPYEPRVAERMWRTVPEARLVYAVRDPIERIVSEYVDRYASRKEHRGLAETVLSDDAPFYVHISSYGMQLEQYLRHYPLEQIHILTREELLRDRRRTLSEVFRFLSVDPSFDTPAFDELRNDSSRFRRVMAPRGVKIGLRPKATGRFSWSARARARRVLLHPVSRPVQRPEVEPELRSALTERLAPDIERFRALTGRRFEEWSL